MRISLPGALAVAVLVTGVVVAPAAVAAPGSDRAADVVAHWTPERVAAAEARDLVVDERGLGYQRRADGRLAPHGHAIAAVIPAPTVVPGTERSQPQPVPRGKPSGDTAGPAVTGMTPAGDATVASSATFSATVTDPSGVRSVAVVITSADGGSSSFAASASGSTYSVSLQNFSPGAWSWAVRATDTRGNLTTAGPLSFTVGAPASPPTGGSDVVVNDLWRGGGAVQTAAGRIFFEMPTTRTQRKWAGYVCSGTVIQDTRSGQSVVLTAAHCVYDDVNKAFARNVLFIPDQGATGTATDQNCANDRLGCWAPSFGVVDTDWTTRTFPDNSPWDYAYYVVPDGTRQGVGAPADSLEAVAGTMTVSFDEPQADVVGSDVDRTTALGYSYSDDPNFMHCAEDMTTEGIANWWLPNCGLSGGASGGPWVQPMVGGDGPVVSVNSWGYTDQAGMAGPKLVGTSASALFADINGGLQPTQARGAALAR
jgi:hypothetical protein